MALFGRRRASQNDDHLPLDVDGAARLRRLVREAFAKRGIDVTVHADHVTDADGQRYGLWNVSAACAGRPRRAWRSVVSGHVDKVLATMGRAGGPERMSEDVLASSTYLRLMELDQLRAHAPRTPHTTIGDRVAVVLSVDQPDAVATPTDDFWERRGGEERWRAVGRANLRSIADDRRLKHQRHGPKDRSVAFDVVMGDSFFTASLALCLDDVVRRFEPDADLRHGVLVAMPFRHQLAYSVVTPGPEAALTLHHLFQFAIAGFEHGAGPISPHVYLVRAGEWKQATAYVDGAPVVRLDDDLARALGVSGEH